MLRDEELDLLLQTLIETYGYDFSNYARSSLKRRVSRLLIVDRFPSFAELFYRVKTDADYLTHFIQEITVNVTEMFRDPHVYKTLREQVLPLLATHP
jgi:chemotaxis protein methyltransferase CheR